ncbi:MAG: hypothetical protein M5U12_15175 [Verrucomicrobia bacterium]|nr:hypothetical protein [Verrucomicrobiota bacterium]
MEEVGFAGEFEDGLFEEAEVAGDLATCLGDFRGVAMVAEAGPTEAGFESPLGAADLDAGEDLFVDAADVEEARGIAEKPGT